MSIRPLLSSLVGEKAAPVRPPVSSFRHRKHAPYPDTGPESRGWMDAMALEQPPTISLGFHASVRRHQRRIGTTFECAGEPLHSSFPRKRESRGVVYGLQMTRKHLHQSAPRFSCLGAPAPAGMSDRNESMSRTPILDRFRHGLTTPGTAAPRAPPLARSATPAKACPVPRYGAGIQGVGVGHRKTHPTRPASSLETQELPCTTIVRLGPWSPPAY